MNLRNLCITVILLLSFCATAYADYIQGHVTEIDRQQGEVMIILCDICTGDKQCSAKNEHDPTHSKDVKTVKVLASWLPRCLSEGMMVFARGDYVKGDTSTFNAVEVFPRKRLGSKDGTGVRSRFRHRGGRGHQEGHHE